MVWKVIAATWYPLGKPLPPSPVVKSPPLEKIRVWEVMGLFIGSLLLEVRCTPCLTASGAAVLRGWALHTGCAEARLNLPRSYTVPGNILGAPPNSPPLGSVLLTWQPNQRTNTQRCQGFLAPPCPAAGLLKSHTSQRNH